MPLKIAVIGCGWVSQACHGPAYQAYASQTGAIELAACCDVDPARAEEFRARFGFGRAYSNFREMLEKEKPAAVCLNVPEKLTCEIGVEILRQRRALLAEKPPGISTAEVDRLVSAANEFGITNMAAFNRRYMPLMAELKRQLQTYPIDHLHYQLARIGRTEGDFSPTAVHAIDAARFLIGVDFQEIQFHYREHPALGKNVVDFHLDCRFTNGKTASIEITPACGINVERAILHGEGRTFTLACANGIDFPGSLRHYEKGQLFLDLDGREYCQTDQEYVLQGFYAEDAAFFDALRSGTPVQDDLRSAHQSVEVMQCLRERAVTYPARDTKGE